MITDKAALTRDANNRSIRTILQNLAFDVLLAIAMLLLPVFTSADGWSDLNWKVLGFSVLKTVLVTIFSWVMRRFLDPSKVPTPLPPSDPGEPDADVDHVIHRFDPNRTGGAPERELKE